MRHILLTIFFSFLSVSIGFSQGTFLKNGESGFEVGAAYASSKVGTAIGGGIGYSIESLADFSVSVSRAALAQKMNGNKVLEYAISPSLEVNFKRDSATIPIFASLIFGYEKDMYRSSPLNRLNESMNGDFFSAGFLLYGNIYVSRRIYIQPSAEIDYVIGTGDLRDKYQMYIQSSDYSTGVATVSAALVFNASSRRMFVIEPAVSRDKDYTTYSVEVDFVMATFR
ncbi:MAG TPA: hypothetical protein VLX91_09825 [Candidatus Acidoferrales bacterium]|nr:hypothetical protein [Candidatus Acidoferrales bacterium]